MKLAPPRLLPIVIAATAALLLFKGFGLVTQGGYSLIGTTPAIAAGGGGGGEAAPAAEGHDAEAAAGGTDMTDTSPTLEDKSVTMQLPSADAAASEGGGHGGAATEGGDAAAAPAEGGDHGATPAVGPTDAPATAEACPPTDAAAPADATAAPAAAAPAAAEGGHGETPAAPAVDPCAAPTNEYGDALPMIKDPATGKMVPLADTLAATSSEAALADRLSERRSDLDQREKELEMRSALIDAAEKRLEERSAEMKALEEKIGKMVDDNKTAEQQQFVSLVAMYENMKPKDAAVVFNQLDMPVMLGLAKAMNPRKMAPILAKMDPLKAKALTDAIAASDTPADTPVAATNSQDLSNLPQIVGQ